jgi:SAM-dependent MidA family methyltransferase
MAIDTRNRGSDPNRGALGLRERLLARISAAGPITFDEFMEWALYEPGEGFYDRPPVGEEGDFVTSPHVSPAFGALLARQVGQVWDLLERPPLLTVAEVGAGDGTLARQILEAVRAVPELAGSLRYVAMERSRGARFALAALTLELRTSLEELEPFEGCILANELLDNLPFRRLRRRNGRTVEVRVGAHNGSLVEVETEAPTEMLALLPRPLEEKEERPVSPHALAFVRQMARVLRRGYCFLFDYGFTKGEAPGPVHAYRHHRVLEDVLGNPGSRDVTAAVDLEALAVEARRFKLSVWGPITQREALLGLGFRTWMSGQRSRQAELQLARRSRDATRLYSERQRASILIDPDKLGGLRLLVFGTKGLPPPAAAIGDRDAGC